MQLRILGSGTMMPTKDRRPSGYLVEHGTARILLDCGHTTIARLIDFGVDLHSIDAVAITHFHTDHFGDLLPLVHARFVDDRKCGREHRALSIIGPVSTQDRFRKLREVMWPEPSEEYPLTFHEYTHGESIDVGPISLAQFPTKHVPWFPSTGYRLTAEGKSLVYPGDIGSDQESSFEDAVRDATVLLIEAGAEFPCENHYTLEQVMHLAQRCNVHRVLITHILQRRVDAARSFLQQYPSTTLAEDGMEISVI